MINHRGEVCECKLTPANVDDRKPLPDLTEFLLGRIYADKGYIDKKLFQVLFERDLQLVTGIRKRMKNQLMTLIDKLLLRKRSLIESAINQLKNVFHLEHSRHRNCWNGVVNMLCAIVAYALHPNKPQLHFTTEELEMLKANA